jgi:hypothetical protein
MSYVSDRSDTSPKINLDGVQNNIIKNDAGLNNNDRVIAEILKSEPRMGYREPFYYCKECLKVQNINHEEIKNHLLFSKVHKSP